VSCDENEMFRGVRDLNPYGLDPKVKELPNVEELRPYYQDLIAKYFPPQLNW